MNQYQTLNKLGQGAFSTVYKVTRKQDSKPYAMKKMRIMNFNQKQLSNCLNQVRILASIDNSNIVAYRDSFYDELTKTFCIITEYLDGGDLAHYIVKNKNMKKEIAQNVIWDVAYQVLKGLRSLHQAKILHRDIKSANIFLGKEEQKRMYKLGDMNVSIVSSNGMARTQTGTPYYASPEVWNERPYSAKCDIWSLGCVLYQMATFRPPFVSTDMKSLKRMIVSGIMKKIPNNYSNQLWQFIKMCLKVDPNQRSSTKQLLQNVHFEKMEGLGKQKTQFTLLGKIQAPKKRQFRIIKDRLPKHRFSTDKSVDNFSCMSERQRQKQNITVQSTLNKSGISTRLTKGQVLPSLRRPISASHAPSESSIFRKSSVNPGNQVQVIEPKGKPPLPLPRNRALRA